MFRHWPAAARLRRRQPQESRGGDACGSCRVLLQSIEDVCAPAEAQQAEPGRIPLIAQELAKVIASNKVVDWDKREAVPGQMRTAIRVLAAQVRHRQMCVRRWWNAFSSCGSSSGHRERYDNHCKSDRHLACQPLPETANLEFTAKNQYDTTRLQLLRGHCQRGNWLPGAGCSRSAAAARWCSLAFADPKTSLRSCSAGSVFGDVEAVEHQGRVVVFSIPGRPKGTAYHHDGAYLMRSGEELVPMSEDQLRKIFAGWSQLAGYAGDARCVCSGCGFSCWTHKRSLICCECPSCRTRPGVLGTLKDERLIEPSAAAFTSCASVQCCWRKIKGFPDISRKAARVIVYAGESKLKTLSDITGEGLLRCRITNMVRYA